MSSSHSSILSKINNGLKSSDLLETTEVNRVKPTKNSKEIDADLFNDFLTTPQKGGPILTPGK